MVRYLIYIILFIALLGCGSTNRGIYETYSKGMKIDMNLVSKAEQIYIYNDYFIFLISKNRSEFYKDYYILFYNKNQKLECASYLTVNGIKDIINGKIMSFKSPVYDKNYRTQIMDLPIRFEMDLIDRPSGGIGGRSNRVINRIEKLPGVNNNNFKIVFSKGERLHYRSLAELNKDSLSVDSVFININHLFKDYDSLYTKELLDSSQAILNNHFLFKDAAQKEEYEKLIFDKVIMKN